MKIRKQVIKINEEDKAPGYRIPLELTKPENHSFNINSYILSDRGNS